LLGILSIFGYLVYHLCRDIEHQNLPITDLKESRLASRLLYTLLHKSLV